MNFLATVAFLSVAAKNTAKLEFSNIISTSDASQCNPPECLLFFNTIGFFYKSELLKCLESVSEYCSYEAIVQLKGELNEFLPYYDTGDVITNVADILLHWGRLDDTQITGSAKVEIFNKDESTCTFFARSRKLPMESGTADYGRKSMDPRYTLGFFRGNTEEQLDPAFVVKRIHAFKDDGLHIYSKEGLDCDGGISKIIFSNVSWRAKFDGFKKKAKDGASATAAKNTAELVFSNITSTSKFSLCSSTAACSLVVNKSSSERFSTTELKKCLESVSVDCRFDASVHIIGKLSEFVYTPDMERYLTNVTNIALQWGSLAKDPEFTGNVKLHFTEQSKINCEFDALFMKIPEDFDLYDVKNRQEPDFEFAISDLNLDSPFPLTILFQRNSEAYIHPELFVRRLLESTNDGLLLHSVYSAYWECTDFSDTCPFHARKFKVDARRCGNKLSEIGFSDVSWRARFEGFGDPISCATDDSSAIIFAAAAIPFVNVFLF